MTVQERVRMCQLIEQSHNHSEYAHSLGLENKSAFAEKEEVHPRAKNNVCRID